MQGEVANAALYRDFVQVESDNVVQVYLHFLLRSADLSLLTSKARESFCQQFTYGAVSKGVKDCGNALENGRKSATIRCIE